MNRRTLLAGVSFSTVVVAGCIGGNAVRGVTPTEDRGDADDDQSDDEDTHAPVEYERCDNRIVRVHRLPDPAEEEATTAIEEGAYETDGDVLLAEVIHVEDVYLRHHGVYYEPTITEDGGITRVTVTETRPVFEESVTLENMLDAEVTIEIRVEHEETDELLVEETRVVEAGDTITFNDEDSFPYGSYHVTVTRNGRSDDVSFSLDQRFESGVAFPVELDENGLFVDPVDRDSSHGPCSWDETGEVSTG